MHVKTRITLSLALTSSLLALPGISHAQQEPATTEAAASAVAPAASKPAKLTKEEIKAKLAALAAAQAARKAAAAAATPAPPPPKPVVISLRDPAIKAATRKAQATLDSFLPIAEKADPNNQAVSLKVAIRDGNKLEHIWVTPFTTLGKSHFTGKINEKPEVVGNVKEGQQWIFGRDDVVDWMYYDTAGHKMHGNYSTCAKLTKGPQADREEMKRMYGLDCSQ